MVFIVYFLDNLWNRSIDMEHVMYGLPEGFSTWDRWRRVEWHRRRVQREVFAADMIFSWRELRLNTSRLLDRLQQVRRTRCNLMKLLSRMGWGQNDASVAKAV